MKRIKIEPVEIDKDGNMIFNTMATEADDDWLHAARLKKMADSGDQEAAKELERKQNTPLFRIIDDEETQAMIKFSDGLDIDTSGPLRKWLGPDGWYVMGDGFLIPCKDEQEADLTLKDMEKQESKP